MKVFKQSIPTLLALALLTGIATTVALIFGTTLYILIGVTGNTPSIGNILVPPFVVFWLCVLISAAVYTVSIGDLPYD